MRIRTWIVWTALLAVAFSTPWAVQAQTTDRAGIEGKVADQGGGVLPGVSVTIASPALLGGDRTTVTNAEGGFRFAALPAGVYQVTLELAGFAVKKREVRVDTGFVATLSETMSVEGVQESLTVTAESPVVDIRTTAVSTNLGKEALEQLPTSRSMWQVMNLAPGLRVSGADVGGTAVGTQQGYANYGTSSGGNKPTLDGVDTREDATGAGFYYDYGALQEVQIKAMGNDAEMATPGTQFMGILKSGGDRFRGSGYFAWETPSLQSDNVTDELRAKGVKDGNPLEAYRDGNVDLGGPVLKRRLWFYGSYRNQFIKQGVLGYSASPGSDNLPGTADDVPGFYEVTLTNITGKLTGQIGPNHRFSGFVQAQEKDYPERNADAFRYQESTWHQVFKPLAGKAEWSWVVSDRTYVNAFVGRWKYDTDAINRTEDAPAYDTVTLRYWGRFLTSPYVGGRDRWQYNGSVTQYIPNLWGGSHDIKAGVEFTDEGRYYDAPAKSGGRDYQLRFQNNVPYQVVAYNFPYYTINDMTTQSAYVRDAWRFGDRATLNLGLRYEGYHISLPAQTKDAGRFYPAGDYPKTEILKWRNWAPRVGLSYPLGASNRTVVKATYGWFNYATQANYGDAYNNNASASTTYRWNDLNGNRDYDDGEFGTFVTATGAGQAAVNPDLKQPKTHEITTSLERQIASSFSARASYVYRREVDRYQNVNVRRPYEAYSIAIPGVDPGPDGVVGTSDDGGPLTYYEYTAGYAGAAFIQNVDLNLPGYTNSFHNVEFAAQKRLSNKWQLVTSVLATHVDQWRTGVPENPNEEFFYPKTQYWEWSYKLAGSYDLPYRIQVAGTFTSQSGGVWARDARFTTGLVRSTALVLQMEDSAANRLPTQNMLNLRVEKRQKIGPGTASFQFDVFNVMNTNSELGVTTRSGASFGRITSIIPPRVARLGVSYNF
jgi:hypothetical protein